MGHQTVAHLKGVNGAIDVTAGESITFANYDDKDSIRYVDTIQAINGSDVVLNSLTEDAHWNGDNDGTPEPTSRITTIPSGTAVYGRFTAIDVSSGTARCYIA